MCAQDPSLYCQPEVFVVCIANTFLVALEHLHRCSVCGPALEILDEVQQSYIVDPPEDCSDPGIMHNFQGPGGALEESNKHIFLD
jgi:hypothetical protein